MRKLSVVVAAFGLCLAGCGDVTAGAGPDDGEADSVEVVAGNDPPASDLDKAPPVTVTHGATVLTLDPWTACWTGPSSSYCADGAPPEEPPDLGTIGDAITVDFPVDGWEFTADLRGVDGYCDLSIPVQLDAVAERTWTLPPSGPAGAYEVDLNGGGPEGDVHVTFAMRTTSDGSMPAPTTTLGLFYDVDGTPTLYDPPTLGLQMLADPSAPVTASITVVAADGQRTPIELAPAPQDCLAPGSVQLTEHGELEPSASGSVDAADRFGPAPYEISVEVGTSGATHVAEVVYPDDLEPESVELRVELQPPLPTATPGAYAPFLDR